MNSAVMSAPISIGSIPFFRFDDDSRPLLGPPCARDTSESPSSRIPDRPDLDPDPDPDPDPESGRGSCFAASRSETLEFARYPDSS